MSKRTTCGVTLALMLATSVVWAQQPGKPGHDGNKGGGSSAHNDHGQNGQPSGQPGAQPGGPRPGAPGRDFPDAGHAMPAHGEHPGDRPNLPDGGAPPRGGRKGTPEEHKKALDDQQAKDRTARDAARKDSASWESKRSDRAAERKNEIASEWGAAATTPEGKAELAQHADRMAKLNRVLDVAQDEKNTALIDRANADIAKENTRHATAMQQIQAKVSAP